MNIQTLDHVRDDRPLSRLLFMISPRQRKYSSRKSFMKTFTVVHLLFFMRPSSITLFKHINAYGLIKPPLKPGFILWGVQYLPVR